MTGIKASTQEAKADSGKVKLSLTPTQIVRDIAVVREYGTKKYHDPDNWKKVELQRYIDAFYRHWLSFIEDNSSVDEESGIEHYKHAACNMAFICELMKQKPEAKESPEIRCRAEDFDSSRTLLDVVKATHADRSPDVIMRAECPINYFAVEGKCDGDCNTCWNRLYHGEEMKK